MEGESEILTVRELVQRGVLERPMDGNHGELHPKSTDFVAEGIPFIMASDLVHGQVDTRNCAFISEQQARSLRKGFAKTGDVLLSHKATMGRTALVGEIQTPYLMLTPQVTYYRVRDSRRLDARYLKTYFDGPEFQELLERWGNKGSTRSYLGISAQLDLPIKLRPITEQRAIAGILGVLDDKIELNRRMNATLEAMARALFKSWFVDFDPVRAKAEGRAPCGMDAETAKLFPSHFVDSEAGPIPGGWRAASLGDCVTLKRGTTYKGMLVGEPGPALLGLGSIRPGGGFRSDGFKTYGGECPPALMLRPSDLYVSLKGATKDGEMIGSVARVPKLVPSGRLTQDTVKLEIQNRLLPRFLYRLLLTPEYRTYCANRAMGSAVVALSREDFLSYPLPLPDASVLERFCTLLGDIEDRAEQNDAENAALAKTRDSLLPRLLSGELPVDAAERLVEALA